METFTHNVNTVQTHIGTMAIITNMCSSMLEYENFFFYSCCNYAIRCGRVIVSTSSRKHCVSGWKSEQQVAVFGRERQAVKVDGKCEVW